jgi:hypothetical protein
MIAPYLRKLASESRCAARKSPSRQSKFSPARFKPSCPSGSGRVNPPGEERLLGRAQQPVAADLGEGEEELDPLSIRAEASCSSSSFGAIFRAVVRLDPGKVADRLLGRWRGRPVEARSLASGCQREGLGRRAAGEMAATQHGCRSSARASCWRFRARRGACPRSATASG